MRDFLNTLFGDTPDARNRISVFTLPGAATRRFSSPDEAANYAISMRDKADVYYGVGLVHGNPSGRGKTSDIACIGGLWADIDMAGDAHDNKKLPASVEQAQTILDAIPLAPSVVVHSGHGLHAYWIFKEPWIFESAAERDDAAVLAKGWHEAVCAQARFRGWHLENLGDLTRVLRLPGTINHKNPRKPQDVRIVHNDPGRRYLRHEFEPYLLECDTLDPVASGSLRLGLQAKPPQEKMQTALVESEKFRLTWTRQRKDLPDQSQSAYDMALAKIAVLMDWTDQEIADLIIAARCKHGQKPEKALRVDYIQRTIQRARTQAQPVVQDVDISGLLPEVRERADPGPENPGPFPDRLLEVPGLIGEVMDFCLATSIRPQPILALSGAICLQAVIAARKVRDRKGNRTNIYVMAIGPSGCGKDRPRTVNDDILTAAGADHLIGAEDFASESGLISAVEAQPAVLFQGDEIGQLLRQIANPKNAHMSGIPYALMKLFSKANSVYRGRAYADVERRRTIYQPCVVLFGTTVPDNLYGNLRIENLKDGFVPRLFIFEAPNYTRKIQADYSEPPEAIVSKTRWWVNFSPGGNLNGQHPQPVLVKDDGQSREVFDAFSMDVEHHMVNGNACEQPIWARADEKAYRLALIYACSENHMYPCIGVNAARWACDVSRYLTRKMIHDVQLWVSRSEFDARQKELIRELRERGGSIQQWELNRMLRDLKKRDRDEMLENLLDTGQLRVRASKTKGRTGVCYFLP